jgi:hypothetical protein
MISVTHFARMTNAWAPVFAQPESEGVNGYDSNGQTDNAA